MKTSVLFSTLVLSTLLLTSCSEDLVVEPSKTTSSTTSTYDSEYHIDIDVRSSLDLLRPTDERQGQQTLHMSGEGEGSSVTFGDVSSKVDLYYGLEDGRLYGTVMIDLHNSDQQLQLRVDHKLSDVRNWSDVASQCLAAMSDGQFAEMDFSGEMCLTDFPEELVEIGTRQVGFTISGILK